MSNRTLLKRSAHPSSEVAAAISEEVCSSLSRITVSLAEGSRDRARVAPDPDPVVATAGGTAVRLVESNDARDPLSGIGRADIGRFCKASSSSSTVGGGGDDAAVTTKEMEIEVKKKKNNGKW